MIRVHLYGTFHCTREALKKMEPLRRGAILNISSVAALQGLPGAPDYSAAKGGIIGITRSVALEVAGAGIRVNAIAPGWIRTPMVQEEIDPRLLPLLLAQVPLGGMGEPEHIAALAMHLCSDEAAYTTGQVVSPNGGIAQLLGPKPRATPFERPQRQRIGGGAPSTLAGNAGSHSHTKQAWRNAERVNSTAAACGSRSERTSSQSRMYSPSAASQRAAGGESVAAANPSGAGCA